MKRQLRVLLIEDCETDALLICHELERGGYDVTLRRVQSAKALRAALDKEKWDLFVSDYRLPQFSGLDALKIIQQKGFDQPFILVSGYIGEETAVAAMKAGAHDYLMKDNLARLAPAVERELKEAEVRRARAQAQLDLEKSNLELAQAREELEQRVRERTSDLLRANQALRSQMDARKRLEAELLESAERERKRIGIDLHDELGQLMQGLSLRLKSLEIRWDTKNPEVAAESRKLQELLSKAMDHAHNVAKGLAAMDWKGDDLGEALSALAAKARSTFGISCRCRVDGDVGLLPKRTIQELYKIAQESLTNAIKHGHCKRVDFHLGANRSSLTLTIKNDGIPFPDDVCSSERMGLHIMRYRASVINARLEIRANGKHGTLVMCRLPLAIAAENWLPSMPTIDQEARYTVCAGT
jgi:signal transduction histidine kinase